MKQDLTRIAVILDRSGSMASVAHATISGFNEFVQSQKLEPGEANLKLVQFDTSMRRSLINLFPKFPRWMTRRLFREAGPHCMMPLVARSTVSKTS